MNDACYNGNNGSSGEFRGISLGFDTRIQTRLDLKPGYGYTRLLDVIILLVAARCVHLITRECYCRLFHRVSHQTVILAI